MIEPTRTIDWVMLLIEALVLVLITYEVVTGQVRHRKEEKRRKKLNELIAETSTRMDKGQRLMLIVPDPGITNWQLIEPWIKSTREWAEETSDFLAVHSSRASVAFLLTADAGDVNPLITFSGRPFFVHGLTRDAYSELVVQLGNLRRITEQADAYF